MAFGIHQRRIYPNTGGDTDSDLNLVRGVNSF